MLGTTSISIELFPPKDSSGEEKMWGAVERLKSIEPDFVAVTYGAGGSNRDRTIRIAEELSSHTGAPTIAHLTCVGSTRDELRSILDEYQAAGISRLLALRGDPQGGPRAPWVTTPGGFDHADQLVELAAAHGGFSGENSIGVAAFPDGHPASEKNYNQDIEVLLRKEALGATFAPTQFFFDLASFLSLRDSLSSKGSQLRLLAGILPISNLRQLDKMAELGGAAIPGWLRDRFAGHTDPEVIKAIGVDIATELSQSLLREGVDGLHFYTMNTSPATVEIVERLRG